MERYRSEKGKDFPQYRPDGKGGWVAGLKDKKTNAFLVRLVPYRLNEWKDLDEVCIVEGCKCADALWSMGIPATCNPMGAGKWRAEYNAHFAGKKVIPSVISQRKKFILPELQTI